MRTFAALLGVIGLVACSQSDQAGGEADLQNYASAPSTLNETLGEAPAPGEQQQPAPIAVRPQLAYDYDYGLEAPPKRLRGLMASHEAACQTAGLQTCQMVSSSVEEMGRDRIAATLILRADPRWLATFRDQLTKDARDAGGRVVSTSVSSEDLSRQIIDTEARLRATITLRDRLQALLASRPGKLQELLETERELARVQGEIDSATSQLAMMKARVATSKLTIKYFSSGVLAPQGLFSPLTKALADFLSLVVVTVSFLIRAVAVVLPVVLALVCLWWLIRKLIPGFRLWRRKRSPENPPNTPPAP